jgi:hypothetical protein
MGLATFAPPEESKAAETRFRSWVEQHPTFIHYWYLARYYQDLGRTSDALAALGDGTRFPLDNEDPDALWVPDGFVFDAAVFACKHKAPELLLAITEMWSSNLNVYLNRKAEIPAFRAAAKLTLGRFKEAREDMDLVLAVDHYRAGWAGNLQQLDSAIRREDRSFVYDPGDLYSEWSLFPPPE